MILIVLQLVLAAATAVFLFELWSAWRKAPASASIEGVLWSFVSNFFDTLGIGSFATTTAYFKFRRLIPDDGMIPATMMVGFGLPTVVEAFVFTNAIKVDPVLLAAAVIACVVGAFVGVRVAARLPVNPIRVVMGLGLLIAAAGFALSNLGLMPPGGEATSLPPGPFAIVVAASFCFGILINLGVGNFAPTLVLVSLLGMDPRAAFPIMMGSGALMVLIAGLRIIRTRPLDLPLVLGMSLGGVPAVLIAAYIVKSLPIIWLRWGVIVVVTYAAGVMLHAAVTGHRSAPTPTEVPGAT
jgi:uncharacterized membrane protein YfcA